MTLYEALDVCLSYWLKLFSLFNIGYYHCCVVLTSPSYGSQQKNGLSDHY